MKYKYEIQPNELTRVLQEIKEDNISVIGIDTETDGLDPMFSTPYQIIIGWYTDRGEYKHYVVDTSNRSESAPFVAEFFEELGDDIKQIYHNAKYDINMIQNLVGEDKFRPTNFFCTLLALAHATKFNTFGLKPISTMLKLRSRFDHIEALKEQLDAQKDLPSKGRLIEEAMNSGLIPYSNPVVNNIKKLKEGIETSYFDMLFDKPDELVTFYKELYTEKISKLFDETVAKEHNWDKSLFQTYVMITNVYSYGLEYESAREILREFNTKYLGFKDEWAPIFKGKKATQLSTISYEELKNMDNAALTIYAGMDVKLTLDLYKWLLGQMTDWTEDQHKVLQIDFDATYAVLMQERTGFKIDTEYILKSMEESKKALITVNQAIEQKFDFIANNSDWKSQVGLDKADFLQANNYASYNKLFETFIPSLPLPIYVDNKKEIKLTSISKLINYLDFIKRGVVIKNLDPGIELSVEDQETEALFDSFLEANKSGVETILVGDDGKGGLYASTFAIMFEAANSKLENRKAEIAEAEANGKKLKLRKEEELIQTGLSTCGTAIELMEYLNINSPTARRAGNEHLKEINLKVTPVTRTINKHTSISMLRIDIEKLGLTEEQKVVAYEGKSIISLKMKEASFLKWIGTYQIKLLSMLSGSKDDRIRSNYKLFGTITGRLSTDVHQFPKEGMYHPFNEGEVLYEPRRAFVADPLEGWNEPAIIAYEDFSQMELRVAAEYTLRYNVPDTSLLQAYIPFNCYSSRYGKFDIDQHKYVWMTETSQIIVTSESGDQEYETIYEWFKDPELTDRWEPVDLHLAPVKLAFPDLFDDLGQPKVETAGKVKKFRNACKGINFGKIYGQGLSGTLGNPKLVDFDREDLIAIYRAQEETYKNLKKFQSIVMQNVRRNGFATNLQGRKYIKGFPWGRDRFGQGHQFAYRGVNYLVQGECAGQLKDRMIALEKYIYDNKLKARLLQNIHDEVAIILPISEKEHIFKLRDIVQDIKSWKINMVSDVEVTLTNWADKLEVKDDEDINNVINGTYGKHNEDLYWKEKRSVK